MTLELLESLSLPGDQAKANEDAFGHRQGAAMVIDGATMLGDGLMPGPSDAQWIAQFGARRLMAHLGEGVGARKALRAALADTQHSFEALRRHPPEEMWQTPCASMMLAVEGEAGLEFLWFGDCAALVKQDGAAVTVVGETFDKRAAEADRARRMAKEKNLPPASALSRPEFIDALRAARNRINSGNNWLFSPDVRAASHVSRRVMKVQPGATILLATDGLLALASDYGAYSVDGLLAAAMEKGLTELGEELRAIESSDAGGDKFPRFKKSDDATALLLRVN
ncbi:MAG TPA: protein phosphatase 2C domain-containing protein [Rhizomicrobium sp.]|jgi:serine/threonine protein phosphatase PrpC|nr:protein phosphatase 2C domain-containing protein [Rhizomicrobium sp.]